ncbi:uncharacterized protein LOC144011524 isoform X3 [Festucalex cinctus]
MCYRNYCKYMSSRKLHLNTRVSEFRELFKFQHGGERRRIREWRPDNWRRVPIGSGVNRCFTIRGTGALFKERGSDGSNARGTGMEKMLGELMAVTCQCSQVVCKILLKMVCCCLPCLDPEQRFVGLMGCLSTRS